MTSRRSIYAGIVGVGVLLGAGALTFGSSGQAAAQAVTPAPVVHQANGRQGAHHGKQALLSSVASQLGVPEQRLADAFVQARAGLLAQHLATALSLNADQIKAGLEQGKTVAQVLADQGKPRDAARSALISALHTRLDQAVKQGRLTANQAAQREQAFGQHVDRLLDRSLKD